jgi:ERCC4-type nuclease
MIADILVTGENQDDVHLAIERKTVEDLRSSLRDGRFAEWSYDTTLRQLQLRLHH